MIPFPPSLGGSWGWHDRLRVFKTLALEPFARRRFGRQVSCDPGASGLPVAASALQPAQRTKTGGLSRPCLQAAQNAKPHAPGRRTGGVFALCSFLVVCFAGERSAARPISARRDAFAQTHRQAVRLHTTPKNASLRCQPRPPSLRLRSSQSTARRD